VAGTIVVVAIGLVIALIVTLTGNKTDLADPPRTTTTTPTELNPVTTNTTAPTTTAFQPVATDTPGQAKLRLYISANIPTAKRCDPYEGSTWLSCSIGDETVIFEEYSGDKKTYFDDDVAEPSVASGTFDLSQRPGEPVHSVPWYVIRDSGFDQPHYNIYWLDLPAGVYGQVAYTTLSPADGEEFLRKILESYPTESAS